MERVEGPGGIECYRIREPDGAELMVSRHGGHAISWKTADGQEHLYLSPDADYSPGKAIRGGVPVIFPQFSDHGPFGRHGFARKSAWEALPGEDTFTLSTSHATLEAWPHEFTLHLKFELSPAQLVMTMTITNPGDTAFDFHAALHTYLTVPDCTQAKVSGLEGIPFLNEVTKEMETAETTAVAFAEEVDRAYFGVGEKPVLLKATNHPVEVESRGFPDIVVWNPGPDHGIGDLPGDGWKQFVCIESALTEARRTLEPGERWTGKQILTISSEPLSADRS